jgi:hypothetical protein
LFIKNTSLNPTDPGQGLFFTARRLQHSQQIQTLQNFVGKGADTQRM